MIRYIDSKKMGRSFLGWLDSHFHFSFAEYYNPDNIQFGALRVINDDTIQPGNGFEMHPHKNMEILSYVIDGELSHADSMKNRKRLTRGQVQYMSAGTGIIHSEHNYGQKRMRFLQIWIYPDKTGYKPTYGDATFDFGDRINSWLPIATSYDSSALQAPIKLHQDINVYATMLTDGKKTVLKTGAGRQTYLVLVEGKAEISGIALRMRDAMEIVEEDVTIIAKDEAHILVIEMSKPDKKLH